MAIVSAPFPLRRVCPNILTDALSYAVYIGILVFYFVFIFFMFPETKRLSAEDASKVFDFDRKGRPLGKAVDVERDAKNLGDEKESATTTVTHDGKQ